MAAKVHGTVALVLMVSLGAALSGCSGGAGTSTAADASVAAGAAPTANGGTPGPGNSAAAISSQTATASIAASFVSSPNAAGTDRIAQSLTILGTPAPAVAAGTAYRFSPAAGDFAGANLVFSISNKPAWAIFDTATGALSGTPTEAEVGSYGQILISVSDGVTSSALARFSIAVTPALSSITLSWSAPTLNANGTVITDLAGYHIHYGKLPTALDTVITVANAAAASQVIGNLTSGTWYFAMSSYNTENIESALTAALAVTVAPVAAAPGSGNGAAPVAGNATGVDLSAANVDAVASVGSPPTDGGIDGKGNAYSANALGTSLTWSGTAFTLPVPGTRSAVRDATIALPAGNYSSLQLLATGVNGNQPDQTFIVTYTDGSTETLTQSLSDWYTPQSYAGESVALAMPARITEGGTLNSRTFNLYGYAFTINGAKTVQSLRLPRNDNAVVLAVALAN